jgi:hypothetical protein
MARSKTGNPVLIGLAAPRARAGGQSIAALFRIQNLLILLIASAYGLLCAGLLVQNLYIGIAVAALPGLAAAILQIRLGSTVVPNRQAIVAWLILVVVAAPWQLLAVTAAGSVSVTSPTDVAKLAATTFAVSLAFLGRVRLLKYSITVKLLLGYAAVAVLGALAADSSSSLLRAARFAAVVLAVAWVTSRITRRRLTVLFVQFSVAVSVISLAGRAAGVSSSLGGRLGGYLLPLHPNTLGFLAAGGLLCATALLVRQELTLPAFSMATPILAMTLVLTQSRTSMIGLVGGLLALTIVLLRSRALLIVAVLTSALLIAGLIQTDTRARPLTALLTHDESTSTTGTLGSRLSEWKAVARLNGGTLTRAVGQGLGAKTVEVNLISAQYASVDGTWVAAYLAAGLVGTLILALSVLVALRVAVRRRDDLAVAVITFLIITSLVADVFDDVSMGLVLFVSVGVCSVLRGRAPRSITATGTTASTYG